MTAAPVRGGYREHPRQGPAVDNPGNRRRKVRELLFEQLGIEDRDDLFLEHEVLWRGTRRDFQVIFSNVRELTG